MSPISDFKVGSYTFENPKTGGRRTFRVAKQEATAKFAAGKYVLSLLTGPDNERSYEGFAFIDDRGVFTWTKKRGTEFERYAKLFETFLRDGAEATGVNVLFEARCVACNRKLTVPSSIRDGIGPECSGKGTPIFAGEARL